MLDILSGVDISSSSFSLFDSIGGIISFDSIKFSVNPFESFSSNVLFFISSLLSSKFFETKINALFVVFLPFDGPLPLKI